jgi:hypothetical protein
VGPSKYCYTTAGCSAPGAACGRRVWSSSSSKLARAHSRRPARPAWTSVHSGQRCRGCWCLCLPWKLLQAARLSSCSCSKPRLWCCSPPSSSRCTPSRLASSCCWAGPLLAPCSSSTHPARTLETQLLFLLMVLGAVSCWCSPCKKLRAATAVQAQSSTRRCVTARITNSTQDTLTCNACPTSSELDKT